MGTAKDKRLAFPASLNIRLKSSLSTSHTNPWRTGLVLSMVTPRPQRKEKIVGTRHCKPEANWEKQDREKFSESQVSLSTCPGRGTLSKTEFPHPSSLSIPTHSVRELKLPRVDSICSSSARLRTNRALLPFPPPPTWPAIPQTRTTAVRTQASLSTLCRPHAHTPAAEPGDTDSFQSLPPSPTPAASDPLRPTWVGHRKPLRGAGPSDPPPPRRWAREPMLTAQLTSIPITPSLPPPRRPQGRAPPPLGEGQGRGLQHSRTTAAIVRGNPRARGGERGRVGAQPGAGLPGRLRGALRPLGRGGGCAEGERENQERVSQEKARRAFPAATPSTVPSFYALYRQEAGAARRWRPPRPAFGSHRAARLRSNQQPPLTERERPGQLLPIKPRAPAAGQSAPRPVRAAPSRDCERAGRWGGRAGGWPERASPGDFTAKGGVLVIATQRGDAIDLDSYRSSSFSLISSASSFAFKAAFACRTPRRKKMPEVGP